MIFELCLVFLLEYLVLVVPQTPCLHTIAGVDWK